MRRNVVHVGDALTLARGMPSESVHCIVTSPPYWGLRSYLDDADPNKAHEMGAEPTLAEYVGRMVALFREIRRVLRRDGACWLNLGDCYAGTKDLCLVPYRVALALQADGWYLRSHVIWHKPNPMPESIRDRPTSAHEAVFLLTRSARYWYDADAIREESTTGVSSGDFYGRQGGARDTAVSGGFGTATGRISHATRNKRNVWTIATRPYSGSHYAVMPPALVVPCILAGCPAKACAECGAGWVRVVERTAMIVRPGQKDTRSQNRTATSGTMIKPPTSRTIGFRPSCDCNADTLPGVTLDPFMGAGTVAMVAEQHGRDWIGFDLDARNAALITERTKARTVGEALAKREPGALPGQGGLFG